MILTHLELTNFRNYEKLAIDFERGLSLFLGPNGVGKSNLAEAIHYLSLARSWRTNEDRLLIKEGAEEATIFAKIEEGSFRRSISITIGKEGKRIEVNGKKVRKLSELSALCNVIGFSPADVPLFMGSPGERRDFLDVTIAKQSQEYLALLTRYGKLLKERNAALKEERPDESLIDILGGQMASLIEPIVTYRASAISSLNRVLPGILKELRGEDGQAKLVYRPCVAMGEGFGERAHALFENAKEGDLRRKSTSVGVQREDFSFLLDGKDLADYGSQGDRTSRLAGTALRIREHDGRLGQIRRRTPVQTWSVRYSLPFPGPGENRQSAGGGTLSFFRIHGAGGLPADPLLREHGTSRRNRSGAVAEGTGGSA